MSQNHFTLGFPLKSPSEGKLLAEQLPPMMPDLFQATDKIGRVHYSRFTVLSEKTLLFLGDFDGEFDHLMADLAKLADVKYEGRKAIVCLVGESLRDTPGIAAKVFGILEDVKIRMISQGASEINLTFVIEEDAATEVVRRLHKEFFAQADPEVFA